MKLFSKAIVLALGTALAGAAHAAEYTFTFAHVLTEDTPNARAAVVFKDEVEKNSDGRIAINIRPAAQLGGDVEIIEQTQMGLVHIAIPPTGNLANFNEQMYLFDLPFLLSDDAAMKRVLDGEVGTELLGTLGKNNLHGIAMWGAGFRNMTNNIRPISSPDDLSGIKMRTLQAPTILATYRAYGANPTAMAYVEVYNGLQQGVVEGQENPLANIASMKFYEVQDYMTLTRHAYHTYAAVMNKQAWDSLPEDLQTVISDAMIVGRDAARIFTDEDEAKIIDMIKDQIEIQELSPEGKAAFVEASQPIYDEFRDKVTPALMDKAIATAKGE
ncbi:MAG: TRAP transporter substrate-binding protein [Marinovum algicola]|jgi:C4-dicarboxylate-binding protein DctP|uniref:C4-dicarboxylate-binding protein DctP n=1 Tax=Marinovum algicola TaxID=42444 RepID=A0A975ZMI3_9RHOB|nr:MULTISPECIES: TRAP transporter substrate-binding protein [Marinovum]AKO96868.1 tripartite ATP-independent periplasmic transporter solute receptor, DctP family [Marinovum algicola DG 898]MDD9740772.1 TRAP transporter substrate-binding protein [Marinovum sp. SP66]SEJ07016.1 C4-dicarboxylate-binding protein DctP [Marinovum algicola]SLN19571.1 C4-dicarboxylate-binding periplasmic protein precursor [Marinovum algicola]